MENFLLKEDLESYYWIGFILADGYIEKYRCSRIRIVLSIKDKNHLEKLENLIDKKIKINEIKQICFIEFCNIDIIKKFVDKFGLILPKTYNCPKFKINDNKKLLSLLIGFIDGDGCIDYQYKRKHPKLRIKVHSSWLEFLEKYKNFCPSCKIKINNQNYAQLSLTRYSELIKLKKFAIKYGLPILKRKWDKIDIKFISKNDKYKKNARIVIKLHAEKVKQKDIANMLKISKSSVCQMLKRKEELSEVKS